ncbi:MAG: ribonuclease P protein component [Firmicutes bacterium]|nr:ribonuclease P protein component [Bacillota bacterium]MBR6823743.1 ribonuclease P protein component [Bacillota bacterium]MBR7114260.1 ribonuclease P protein component [Bacillota bacterium]
MLHKQYRLREKQDFRRVYNKGRSMSFPYFVVYFRGNGGKPQRIGFSVSKKVGKSTVRNFVKRRMRHAAKELLPCFRTGYDYIFIVRASAAEASYAALRNCMADAISAISTRLGAPK